jgi:hypothetical protein
MFAAGGEVAVAAGGGCGFGSHPSATISLGNAVLGLLGRGRTAEAAALIDPLITGPVYPDTWLLHWSRAEIDLLRGQLDAAGQRLARIDPGFLDFARDFGQDVAEVALWAGRAQEAHGEVQRLLERLEGSDWVILSGRLLTVGMRACADLAERGRARRDEPAVRVALAAAGDLATWVNRTHGVPFTEPPYVATIRPSGPPGTPNAAAPPGGATRSRGALRRTNGRPSTTGTAPGTRAGARPRRCWPRRTAAEQPPRRCCPRRRVSRWNMCR